MVQLMVVDNLKVRVYDSRIEGGVDMAKMVIDKIKLLLGRKEYVNIIFAAAPSQNEFLEELANSRTMDWKWVNAFHMDEYIGLDKGAPQRFGNFLKERIFDKIPFHSVHYLDGNAKNLKAECQRYSDLLRQYPADIVCMGIGENTHIAFNDPHVADFKDMNKVKVVSLDEACRQQQVNDGCFEKLSRVPAHALTLTIPALLAAEYIYCMVPGKNKAEAVNHTINESISEKYPSTILRRHKNSILFLDPDSSAQIRDAMASK